MKRSRNIFHKVFRKFGKHDSSENSDNAPEEKYGLFVFQPETTECSIDIVAVHGLGGHYEKTWTWNPPKSSSQEPCNWLKDLLPSETSNARILSFGYNSAVAFSKSIGDIAVFAEQLLSLVLRDRMMENQKSRPIIFVAHSLGGLVVKKAIMIANERRDDRPACQELVHSIKGILFMGTPHRGSDAATLGAIGAKMLRAASVERSTNADLVKELEKGSNTLREISRAFAFSMKNVPITSFIETDSMDYLSQVIVSEDSARLNVRNEDVYHLNGNHSSMCKFAGRTENYKTVSSVITKLVNDSRDPVSDYLSALQALTLASERPNETIEPESVAWFFDSPEFTQWDTGCFEALWVTGMPGTGKTTLAFYLRDYLRQRKTYNSQTDIVFTLCRGSSHEDGKGQFLVARILSTLIQQLLGGNPERRALLADTCKLPEPPSRLTSPSLSDTHLEGLWQALSASISVSTTCSVVLIVDGADEILDETARGSFLRNLLHLQKEVRAKRVAGCKILLTSRAYEKIRVELEGIPTIEKDKERQECLRSLRFDEFSARRDRVETALEDTCHWIESDEAYKNWDSSHKSSLLLIRGKPGSGKSTLAKAILERKKREHESFQRDMPGFEATYMRAPEVVVVDFFFSFRGGKKETSHKFMLQSLLFQMLSQDASLLPLFQPIFRAARTRQDFEWGYNELKGIFSGLSSQSSRSKATIYIFIDAMDESADRGRPEILKQLETLCSSESSRVFKCLVATRPLPVGQIDSESWNTIILERKNQHDIENLIRAGLNDLSKTIRLVKSEPNLLNLEHAFNYMATYANGVFLWVALVLQELNKLALTGISQAELKSRLEGLPTDLEDFYSLIINRLVTNPHPLLPDGIEKGTRMLNWVTFAGRPLTEIELRDAIAVPSPSEQIHPEAKFLVERRVSNLEARIKACCGSLIETRGSVVQLLHLTVREYLLREDRSAHPFDTNEEKGDMEISSCSIRYLLIVSSLPQNSSPMEWSGRDYRAFVKWLAEYPLLAYIAEFLPLHLRSCVDHSAIRDDWSSFLKVLGEKEALHCLLGEWSRLFPGGERSYLAASMDGMDGSFFLIRCLIFAAQEGLDGVVHSILNLGTNLNEIEKEVGMTVLQAKSSEACESVVLLPQEAGANLKTVSGPLHNGSDKPLCKGNERLLQILLETKADPNHNTGCYESALRAASFNGQFNLVEMLLETGIDLDHTGVPHGSALQAASFNGNIKIIDLLLNRGASIDLLTEPHGSALQAASFNGQIGIIDLLLNRGASVDLRAEPHGSALQAASFNGQSDTIQILLNCGASIDLLAEPHGSALQAASLNGHINTVRVLLNRGASIDLLTEAHGSALQAASFNGHSDTVRFLLNRGASINLFAEPYGSALQAASLNGHIETVRLLLDSGANPNLPGGLHGSALQAASLNGHIETVQLLLNSGADFQRAP